MASERNHRPLSRRQFLRGLLLVGGTTLVGACAPAPATPEVRVVKETQVVQQTVTVKETVVVKEPAKAGGPIVVRFSVWPYLYDRAAYDTIADRFNEEHADIKVIPEQYMGAYYEKIQTNFAGGTSADVLYFQGWSWQAYADKELLVPLDDYIKKDNWTAPWPDLELYNNYAKWHGHTFMSPADSGAVILFYNKQLFEKRGVPLPTPNWTLDDLKSAIEKLTFEENGVKYYGWAQAAGWNGAYCRIQHFWRTNGALEVDRVVEPREARFTLPEVVDAFQYFVYDTTANGFSPTPAAIAGGGVSIATGRVAMCMEGPWTLVMMSGDQAVVEGGLPFDVINPPVGTAGFVDTEAETSGHVISKQSKNPEAAWELIKYISSDVGQKAIADGGRMCGTPEMCKKHWIDNVGKKYNFQGAHFFVEAMHNKARGVIVGGAGANFDAFLSAEGGLNVARDQMLGGQKRAKEALEEANAKLQKLLDEYWKKKGEK